MNFPVWKFDPYFTARGSEGKLSNFCNRHQKIESEAEHMAIALNFQFSTPFVPPYRSHNWSLLFVREEYSEYSKYSNIVNTHLRTHSQIFL